MAKIRILIVDDAVVVRRLLSETLAHDPDIEVVGVAANGRIALQKIPQCTPDLVTLDVEMPEMDGLATLRELRRDYPVLPVIMFSTLTERGATATLDALTLGASDYVTKPANVGSVAAAIERIRAEMVPKIKGLCRRDKAMAIPAGAAPAKASPAPSANTAATALPRATGTPRRAALNLGRTIDVVAIGVSTGGPNALADLIPAIDAALGVPILITQHMPAVFTRFLAERLNQKAPFTVVEGADDMVVKPGEVYVAPGDFHMTVKRVGRDVRIALNQDPPENSCRPAVDVMMRSMPAIYGSRILAVILTGMGQDGLRGCELIREAGGRVIVQDEASSVVWGMPGFVARAGLAEAVLPLPDMARGISAIVSGVAARPALTLAGART